MGGHRRIALRALNAYLAKNSPQLSRADIHPNHRLRVLVVEDDEATRDLYRCQFERWDLPVDCTWMSSALDALMDIASIRPDLLITDLSMSGVDGIEMLRTIKRNKQLAEMQIIVISGMSVEAIAARGGLPPDARLVQKPINFDWLEGGITALVMANAKWR